MKVIEIDPADLPVDLEQDHLPADPDDESLSDIERNIAYWFQMRTYCDNNLMEWVAEADRREFYLRDGHSSTAEWLSNFLGAGFGRTDEYVDVAISLQELPLMSEAFSAGKITYDHLRALTQVANADNEEALLEAAEGKSVGQAFALMRKIKEVSADESLETRGERWLQMRWDKGRRMLLVYAQLPEEQGARFEKVIDSIAREIPDDPSLEGTTPMGVKRADALSELASSTQAEGAAKANVVIHVEREVLASGKGNAEIEGGPMISAETAMRLRCDACLEVVIEENGKPISVGRKFRTVPARTARELRRRDRCCRWPGCRRTKNLIAHHIDEWARDEGSTDLDNLVLLCEVHHIMVHEGKFRVRGEPPNIWINRTSQGLPPLKVGPPDFTEDTASMFEWEAAVVMASGPMPDS